MQVISVSEFEAGNGEPRVLAYRVRDHGAKLVELDAWRRGVDTSRAGEKVTVDTMAAALKALADTVDGMRKALIGFALAIAGSAVVFAFTILTATGRI